MNKKLVNKFLQVESCDLICDTEKEFTKLIDKLVEQKEKAILDKVLKILYSAKLQSNSMAMLEEYIKAHKEIEKMKEKRNE